MASTGKIKRILHDMAGGFGDIGVFFPLALALVSLLTGNLTAGAASGILFHNGQQRILEHYYTSPKSLK